MTRLKAGTTRCRWIQTLASPLLMLVLSPGTIGSLSSVAAEGPSVVQTFEQNGKQIIGIIVPGMPPQVKAQPVAVPQSNPAAGINILRSVPAFYWSYGCSATAAAMVMGYYDIHGYPNMYTGSANGGLCPTNNGVAWGYTSYPSVLCGECPLSATHLGVDGRSQRGHVDDYWIDYNVLTPDPCVANGWLEHQPDCTADFMGTSQSKFGNPDGSTTFYYYTDGSALHDFTDYEPWMVRDGCHGLKLFANSRGYTVADNFSQLIYGYNGNTQGFTYNNFKAEIDAGRPVLIQVVNHTMVGFGYNDAGSTIYIHDTWDNSEHSMPWGGAYSGLQHWGVTVLQVEPVPPVLTITCTSTNSVLVSWPSPSTGWNLQQNLDLATSNWTAVAALPADDGMLKTVIVSPLAAGSRTFYRLQK